MRVLFVSELDYSSGSFLYRILSPINGLIIHNHKVKYVNNIKNFATAIKDFKPDFIVCYKFVFKDFFKQILSLSAEYKIPLYYDIDDLSYDNKIIWQSRIFDFAKNEKDHGTMLYLESCKKAMQSCDGVIVSTASLLTEVNQVHSNVYLVNNYFPDSYFEYMKFQHTPNEKKRIMYTGSSELHGLFLEEIHEFLYYILSNYQMDIELVICGGIKLPQCFDKFSKYINYINYMDTFSYLTMVANSELILAPIFLDRFTVCKSWVKGLEAEIAGVSWIASPHKEYESLANMSNSGMIANGFYQWLKCFHEVLDKNEKKLVNDKFLSSQNIMCQYDIIYSKLQNK